MFVQQNIQEKRTDDTDFQIRDAEIFHFSVNADCTYTPIGAIEMLKLARA